MEPHLVSAVNLPQIVEWLKHRGGLAIWNSADISDPDASWTTPVNQADGTPTPKPYWKAENTPARIITDPAEVVVMVPKVVKRFHVAVRMGRQGMALKVTDGGTNRIKREVRKATAIYGDAWYEFDYGSYENALIVVPDVKKPLPEFTLGDLKPQDTGQKAEENQDVTTSRTETDQ